LSGPGRPVSALAVADRSRPVWCCVAWRERTRSRQRNGRRVASRWPPGPTTRGAAAGWAISHSTRQWIPPAGW